MIMFVGMKREVVFRGKRIDNGQWHIGTLVEQGDDYFADECHGRIYNCNVDESFEGQLVDSVTIGQITGSLIGGRIVFEGDIVEFDEKEWGSPNNKFVVEWDEIKCGWSFGGGSVGDMSFRTVIGNIHDNPELLK